MAGGGGDKRWGPAGSCPGSGHLWEEQAAGDVMPLSRQLTVQAEGLSKRIFGKQESRCTLMWLSVLRGFISEALVLAYDVFC